MTRHARRILDSRTLAMFVACAMAACHRGRTDGPAPRNTAPPPAPVATVDRLAPGELLEGPAQAFELKLPAGMEVTGAFASVVYAWGQIDPMQVANYLRGRVEGGAITVGAAATVFDRVTTRANPARLLRIRVDATGQGRTAHLEVEDVTPPPVPAASSQAERWRQVGLTPDGKLLDPSRLR